MNNYLFSLLLFEDFIMRCELLVPFVGESMDEMVHEIFRRDGGSQAIRSAAINGCTGHLKGKF